jgi:RNA polymerase sigma-70 factor (ECF subfamily)
VGQGAPARTVAALIAALRGDAGIDGLLARRVRLTIDAGGAASLPAGVVTGRLPAADALRDLFGRFTDPQPAAVEVNGAPGIVVRSCGRAVAVIAVHPRGRQISELWVIANPDKLRHWASS